MIQCDTKRTRKDGVLEAKKQQIPDVRLNVKTEEAIRVVGKRESSSSRVPSREK